MTLVQGKACFCNPAVNPKPPAAKIKVTVKYNSKCKPTVEDHTPSQEWDWNANACKWELNCPEVTHGGKKYKTLTDSNGYCCSECYDAHYDSNKCTLKNHNATGKGFSCMARGNYLYCNYINSNGKSDYHCITRFRNSSGNSNVGITTTTNSVGSSSVATENANKNPGVAYCYHD